MGFDAYALVAALSASRAGQPLDIDGATGALFLDAGGRVHRRLAWAQFQNGSVVALPHANADGGPIQDLSDAAESMQPGAADQSPWDESAQDR